MAIVNQGAAGVRVELIDQSERNILPLPNTIAGVVGSSSRGAFNRILRLNSTAQMDSVLGNGFNNSFFNQGLYAARGVLRNGGFAEFVRPYGEEVDEDSTTERELKADTFLVRYKYNTETPTVFDGSKYPKQSIFIDHFASTRHEDDGYADFGSREIFTIDKALTENTNVNFSLSSDETVENVTNIKEIALFAIINEDPTASDRADDADDDSSDKLTVTTATYKTAHTVTDILEYDSTVVPSEGDTFTAKAHDSSTVTFEFDAEFPSDAGNVTLGNIRIYVGSISDFLTATQIMNNIETAVKAGLTDVKVTRSGFKLTVERYYGVNDIYNSSTQNKIFNESTFETYLNVGFSATRATVVDSFVILNSGFGRNFMSLGLANEAYVKDNVDDSTFTRHFLLTETGKEVAQIYLQVDYRFFGRTFTFSGTIVPFVYQDTNLYIGNAADSVAAGFKFLPNESEDLVGSTEDTTFDLAQSRFAFVVRAATIANITLSGTQTVDTVVLAVGDRVLVWFQTNGAENGIYIVQTGEWTRAADANNIPEVDEFVNGSNVWVSEGTQAGAAITLDTANPIVLGSTALTFIPYYSPTPTLDNIPLKSLFSKFAFDENDPAITNDAIWTYDPRLNKSSSIVANAWLLFLDKDKSDVDMLVAAGTDVSNLGVRNLEQLDFSVIEQMLDICEKRKDCFALLDGLDESNIDTALAKMVGVTGSGEAGRWASIFDGRSIFFDSTYTKLNVEAVKSIEMAGIISNNRRGGLYWIPPAGKDFGTIPGSFATRQKFVRKYNFAEDPNSDIARLYDSNINPTRVTEAGMIIYGQKTLLRRSSALNRLNVIMLVAGMHKKFVKFLDTKVFNLNTAALRAGIVSTLNSEVERIKNANPSGLFTGTVICDETNNPPEVIDQNKMFVDLIIQPTRAAEFITLRTTVQRTGDELTITNVEIIGG